VNRKNKSRSKNYPVNRLMGKTEMGGVKMHNPPHPGEIIREQCIEPLGLTITAAAKGLGVTRKALSELVNGHSGVSPEVAIRLSKAFGSSPETWLRMQLQPETPWRGGICVLWETFGTSAKTG
jgi:addiction module HigA family antidote